MKSFVKLFGSFAAWTVISVSIFAVVELANGQTGRTSTVTNELIELSRAPLSAELFDVPAGYTLAKNYQAL